MDLREKEELQPRGPGPSAPAAVYFAGITHAANSSEEDCHPLGPDYLKGRPFYLLRD